MLEVMWSFSFSQDITSDCNTYQVEYTGSNLNNSRKYFSIKDANGNIFYSEDYGKKSKISESFHVEFKQNGKLSFGKIKFFVEVPLSSEHDYSFACIQPLCWQNFTELHLLNGLNRYVTDEVSEQQILVKLEDLKRIIGVFPLDKQINGKDMKVVVPF